MNPARRQEGLKRARRVLRVWRSCSDQVEPFYALGGLMEQKMLRTRCPCSCIGCGNQRQWEGPTLQERRASDAFQAQMDEVI